MSRRWLIVGCVVAMLALVACEATPATPTRAPASSPTATRASLGQRATETARAAGQPSPSATSAQPAAGEIARVERVVDGDTIVVEIDGRTERLRYIGIDAPESVRPDYPVECFGPEASKENARLVGGREVELARDVSNRDRFGRLLRYVYVRDPATGERIFVNLRLVEEGYANAATFPPDLAHVDDFRAAEREAREAGRGLWGACPRH